MNVDRMSRTTLAHVAMNQDHRNQLPRPRGTQHVGIRWRTAGAPKWQMERVLRRPGPLFMGSGNRAQYRHTFFFVAGFLSWP
jgi:hypothetical protein